MCFFIFMLLTLFHCCRTLSEFLSVSSTLNAWKPVSSLWLRRHFPRGTILQIKHLGTFCINQRVDFVCRFTTVFEYCWKWWSTFYFNGWQECCVEKGMPHVWVGSPLWVSSFVFFVICSVPLSRYLLRLLCVFPKSSSGTSAWIMRHCLEEKLVCIVDNSDNISVSPMENFLLWIRIIQMINALVFIFMTSRATQEKVLMESMILTRDRNRGLV